MKTPWDGSKLEQRSTEVPQQAMRQWAVSVIQPEHSHLTLHSGGTMHGIWMESKRGRGSLYSVYKPHAEILTSYWLLGHPGGCFFNYDKKAYEPW